MDADNPKLESDPLSSSTSAADGLLAAGADGHSATELGEGAIHLAEHFGYKHRLDRRLRQFASFAFAFSSYLGVVASRLRARLRGEWPPPQEEGGRKYFRPGKCWLSLNIIAVVYLVLMAINMSWPRKETFSSAPPFHWYLQFGGYIFVGGVIVLGGIYYYGYKRHRTGVVAEHRA